MKRLKRVAILVVLIVVACMTVGCQGEGETEGEEKTLKLGIVNVTTGPMAPWGVVQISGALVAIDEVNKAGGITIGDQQYLLEAVVEDDRGDPTESMSVFEKMINDGIKFFVGPNGSAQSFAVGPLIQEEKVVCINIALASGSSEWEYTYSAHFDMSTSTFLGDYMFNELGIRRLALMTAQNDFGISIADAVRDGFESAGGEIVIEEFFMMEDTDFYPQLTAIKKMQPDGLMLSGQPDPIVLNYAQALELEVAPYVMGTCGLSNEDVLRLVDKETVQGAMALSPMQMGEMLTIGYEKAEVVHAKMREKSGDDIPSGTADHGYDGVIILAEALQRANSLDTSEVINALATMPVPDSTWTFEPLRNYIPQNGLLYGNITHKIMLEWLALEWQDDGWKFVDYISMD